MFIAPEFDLAERRYEAALSKWLARHPDSRYLPGWLTPAVNALERHREAKQGVRIFMESGERRQLREELQQQIEQDEFGRGERRRAEQAIAASIGAHAVTALDSCLHAYDVTRVELEELSAKLANCRTSGTAGVTGSGGHVVAWDSKCGSSKLCPDEAREEQKRMAVRYVPPIREFLAAHPAHRAFYVVLTWPNFAPGELAQGRAQLFNRFLTNIYRAREVIPEDERTDRRRLRAVFPEIQGALVTDESPLSVHGDWNVHLNVVLLVKGRFDYVKLRREWGANAEIREIKDQGAGLTKAILEVVKYPVKHVSHKADEGKTKAPALADWNAEQFIEWYAAHKGSRRTRSYGVLFRVDAEEEGERLDMNDVEWLGPIHFDRDAAGYRVGLIPGDNFSFSSSGLKDSARDNAHKYGGGSYRGRPRGPDGLDHCEQW